MKVSDYPIQNGRIDKWINETFSLLNSSYQDNIKVKTLFSRTKIKDLILSGNISIDGIINKNPSYKINSDNIIIINKGLDNVTNSNFALLYWVCW